MLYLLFQSVLSKFLKSSNSIFKSSRIILRISTTVPVHGKQDLPKGIILKIISYKSIILFYLFGTRKHLSGLEFAIDERLILVFGRRDNDILCVAKTSVKVQKILSRFYPHFHHSTLFLNHYPLSTSGSPFSLPRTVGARGLSPPSPPKSHPCFPISTDKLLLAKIQYLYQMKHLLPYLPGTVCRVHYILHKKP